MELAEQLHAQMAVAGVLPNPKAAASALPLVAAAAPRAVPGPGEACGPRPGLAGGRAGACCPPTPEGAEPFVSTLRKMSVMI